MMIITRRLSHRGTAALLCAAIGSSSLWLLGLTCSRIYYEYRFYPRSNRDLYIYHPLDLYIYLPVRSAVFNAGLLAWAIVGLAASVLLFRAAILNKRIEGWAARTTLVYLAGFAVLFTGVVVGVLLRRIGL